MLITNSIRFNNVRGDIFGGVTAAIVSLPLALAFGVASGIGPIGGLYGNNLGGDIFGGVTTAVVSPGSGLWGWGPSAESMGQFVAAFLPPCLAVSQR